MKFPKIGLKVSILCIIVLLITVFAYRTDRSYINEVTGSRKGWTELAGFLRVGEWYQQTKLEEFALEHDIPFNTHWVSYQGTTRILFGLVTIRGHGSPSGILSFRPEWVDAYVAHKSPDEIKELIKMFIQEDETMISKEIQTFLGTLSNTQQNAAQDG